MARRDNTLAQYVKPSRGKKKPDQNLPPNTDASHQAASSSRRLPSPKSAINNTRDQSLRLMTRYGNTSAIIQDAFRAADGSIAFYRDLAVPADSLPGKGPQKWLEEKQRRIQMHTKMLEVDDYTWKARATCQPAHIALRKYQPYKKLFGERKFPHKYSTYPPQLTSSTCKEPVTFFDLPGEIRNRIYRLALVFDEPFEFLPKAAGGRKAPARACVRAKKLFAKSLGLRKLLRVNKQVNKEASDIFYGENLLCFSSVLGWQFLRGFIETIGKDNAARLRKITVHIHWPGRTGDHSDRYGQGRFPPDEDDAYDGLSPEGFFYYYKPLDKIRTSDEAYAECMKMLNEAGILESLNLVLPYTFDVLDFPDLALDITKFEIKPKIKLIHLNINGDWTANDSQHPLRTLGPLPKPVWTRKRRNRRNLAPAEPPVIEEFETAKAYAVAKGWEYKPRECDEKGHYRAAKDMYWGVDGIPKDVEEGYRY
ncbi:hypothetical protein M409DRAFT_26763 [Zasmidium cellare ATCC 36951]|uniref:Uncharacterized protein n=1 Tax=Zasmidium cellare ATCC 36951 TaxID=1080233 RepID=A0A6A6C785_ZASCE|nr:uncharacterized protein M409DRAFT_26763 [Zasmidium cellare ATCC 36951]KAF2162911.1 hypothetical protein M409DRAFT_26763 [Zasmidium cellare ATCC 36951]